MKYQCDVCGEMKDDCETKTVCGIETEVCKECEEEHNIKGKKIPTNEEARDYWRDL